MNAFDLARGVEAQAMVRLLPFVEERAQSGRYVVTDKGRLAPFLQEIVGDVIFNDKQDRMWSIEIKAERRFTGNLFLETWSNRNLENPDSHARRGSNVGWLAKLQADLLFYYFLDVDRLFIGQVFALKRWAFGHGKVEGRLYDYKEVTQAKYAQLNDTVGRLVSIADLCREMAPAPKLYSVSQLDLFPEGEAA